MQPSDLARENYKAFINEGNKLPYEKLKELNTVWGKDYLEAAVEESDVMMEYVKYVQN